jgi:transposase
MLPQHLPAPPPPPVRIGVGLDTARYGHYAVFLHDDLQPAAAELAFAESAAGYAQLRHRLDQIARRHAAVHFVVRLDAAGQYADNLLPFLHRLGTPSLEQTSPFPNASLSISGGDPQRNQNYRAALFGSQKSDPVEARAAARFALSERPAATPPLTMELRMLRQAAGRLQATGRQRTRLINQLHHLLALTFPELALLVKDLAAGWVLELVHRYPTAPLLAAAAAEDLAAIAYLPQAQIEPLLEHARTSVGSLAGPVMAELVRDQVRQLRDVTARQKRLENMMVCAYRALPTANHFATIPGLGEVTAAVLTAFILDLDRFQTPGQLVAYFGVIPIEMSSGVDRDGQPRGSRRYVMSKRGNDLVRRYLWMAALSAVQHNPAVRALYRRVVAKHPQKKAVAIGHAMRKLLHLVFAIGKSGRPFDPQHHAWEEPDRATVVSGDTPMSVEERAAGHKRTAEPARTVVIAARGDSVAPAAGGDEGVVDFGHLKKQLRMAQVVDQLGLTARLRGTGAQRRCACPIHRGDGRGRTFSVNLDQDVFQCFAKECGAKGDVIDLWAALRQLSLREAARDLVRTFDLEPCPGRGTEKRNGPER